MNSNSCILDDLYGGSCLPGPESRSTIREIILNLNGKIKGDIYICGFAAYGSTIRIADLIQLNAKELQIQGNIYEKKTIGSLSVISATNISGYLMKDVQGRLKVDNSNIQIIESVEIPSQNDSLQEHSQIRLISVVETVLPEITNSPVTPSSKPLIQKTDDSVSVLPDWTQSVQEINDDKSQPSAQPQPNSNKQTISTPKENKNKQHINQKNKPKSKWRTCLSGCGIILVLLFLGSILLIIHFYREEKRKNLSTPTISIEKVTITSVNNTLTPTVDSNKTQITPSSNATVDAGNPVKVTITPYFEYTLMPNKPTKTNTPTIIVPSLTNTITERIAPSSTPSQPSNTPTKTAANTPTQNAEIIVSEVMPSEIPTSTPVETPTEMLQFGVIQNDSSIGTLFYVIHNRADENVIRFLTNGTRVEVLDGPVRADNTEWYQIYVEQYNRTGWVTETSVILDID